MKLKNFFPEIDRLRAMCCLMVVIHHWSVLRLGFTSDVPSLFACGSAGIHLFFLISGFVVTLSFMKEEYSFPKEVSALDIISMNLDFLKHFWKKRIARLFPSMIVGFLLIGVALYLCHETKIYLFVTTVWQNYFAFIIDAIFGVYNYSLCHNQDHHPIHLYAGACQFWSLSVEFMFYLIWPIVFLMLKNNSRRFVFSLISALLVLYVVRPFTTFYFQDIHKVAHMYYYSTFSNIDFIFFGVCMALIYNNFSQKIENTTAYIGGKILPNILSILLIVVLWVYPVINGYPMYSTNFVAVLLVSILLLTMAIKDNGYVLDIPIVNKILEYLGKRSYTIYVLHNPVGAITVHTVRLLDVPEESVQLFENIGAIFGLLLIVEIVYRLIETPMRKWARSGTTIVQNT